MPKYVVSSTLTDPVWSNTTVISGDVLEEVAAGLRDEHDGDVVVHGSAQLAQALLEQDLVDELRLMVFPVVLGDGNRLWANQDQDKTRLTLVEHATYSNGVQLQVWDVIR